MGESESPVVAEGPQPPDAGGRTQRERPEGPVLAVFAHPDDAEIAAGGTLGRWAAEGVSVHLLVLTNGDRGSEDPNQDRDELAAIRLRETEAAAGLLGLAGTRVLPIHDGELQNTEEVRAEIARSIRETRPQIVVTCDPTAWFFGNTYYNHSDHRTAGVCALDGVFPGAGNPLFFSGQLAEGLSSHKVPEVWLAWTLEPGYYHDISGFMDLKIAALAEHVSQVQGQMLGLFEEWLPKEAEEHGRKIGVRYAEAFRVLTLE